MRYLIYISLLVFITGCTVDEGGLDSSQIDADACEESGGSFCNTDEAVTSLELVLRTSSIVAASLIGDCDGNSRRDPITGDKLPADASIYCFDFSGMCNEAGLSSAFIIGRTSFDNFSTSINLGSCQRGRFNVQLRTNINPVDLCKEHTLELELIGKKADESEVRNPARAVKRARFRANDPSCL